MREPESAGRFLIVAATAVMAVAGLLAVPAAAQCPMCRTGLESPEAIALAGAFNRAILFLLAIPFLAVAAIAGMIVVERRRRSQHDTPATRR